MQMRKCANLQIGETAHKQIRESAKFVRKAFSPFHEFANQQKNNDARESAHRV